MKGFTLMELMVVTVVVGILAAIGIPRLSIYIADARLQEAKPYMMAIAAQQRIYFNETGNYLSAIDEQVLEDTLGVDLNDAGNFCFMVYCAASCTGTNPDSSPIVAAETGDAAIQFEVYAVLRYNAAATGNDTTTPVKGAACTAADNKLPSSNWVVEATSTTNMGEGRMLVLRYPPPPNGSDTTAGNSPTINVPHDWTEGFSATNALIP